MAGANACPVWRQRANSARAIPGRIRAAHKGARDMTLKIIYAKRPAKGREDIGFIIWRGRGLLSRAAYVALITRLDHKGRPYVYDVLTEYGDYARDVRSRLTMRARAIQHGRYEPRYREQYLPSNFAWPADAGFPQPPFERAV